MKPPEDEQQHVSFTIRLPRKLSERLDAKHAELNRKLGVELTKNQFFAHVGESFLREVEADRQGSQ